MNLEFLPEAKAEFHEACSYETHIYLLCLVIIPRSSNRNRD